MMMMVGRFVVGRFVVVVVVRRWWRRFVVVMVVVRRRRRVAVVTLQRVRWKVPTRASDSYRFFRARVMMMVGRFAVGWFVVVAMRRRRRFVVVVVVVMVRRRVAVVALKRVRIHDESQKTTSYVVDDRN